MKLELLKTLVAKPYLGKGSKRRWEKQHKKFTAEISLCAW